jgi:hypothetical protein
VLKVPLRFQFTVMMAVVVLSLASARPGAATDPGAADLVGTVLDETGAILPGATVDLEAPGAPTVSTVTDQAGGFRFKAAAGRYTLVVRLINFTTWREALTLNATHSARLAIVLHLALNADVIVTARRTFRTVADSDDPAANLVGIAAAASEGAVTGSQLETRPLLRAGEVMETVPGVIVSQHSGEGKANQYYLRGFNLDHGTDFATTVAGVPVNLPTHAHGHGYTDLNFLIPELVSGVQFKKGPYYADTGDFSAAGAANINYLNVLDRSLVGISGGQDGWGRIVAATSPAVGDGHVLVALEVDHDDGPWVQSDDYRKVNGVVRYSRARCRTASR